jgi:hypothetical protein
MVATSERMLIPKTEPVFYCGDGPRVPVFEQVSLLGHPYRPVLPPPGDRVVFHFTHRSRGDVAIFGRCFQRKMRAVDQVQLGDAAPHLRRAVSSPP